MPKKLKKFLLDIFFPAFCSGCKKEGSFLCENCKEKLLLFSVPFNFPQKSKISKLYCATKYKQKTMEQLIYNFKYAGIKELKKELAPIIIDYLEKSDFKKNQNQILVPVPLHTKRSRERGFNQSELLAEEIGKYFNIPIETKILKRIKDTKHQTKQKNKEKRKKNIKNAFTVSKEAQLEEKEIILVDDIITTGATLKECAKALSSHKTSKILAVVVAK